MEYDLEAPVPMQVFTGPNPAFGDLGRLSDQEQTFVPRNYPASAERDASVEPGVDAPVQALQTLQTWRVFRPTHGHKRPGQSPQADLLGRFHQRGRIERSMAGRMDHGGLGEQAGHRIVDGALCPA